MFRKLALAIASASLSVPAIPQDAPLYANIDQIRMVICEGGAVSGTAFRTGSGAYTTANHLTDGRNCEIDGEPAQVTWHSAELDIAIVRTSVHGDPLKVNCGGFHDKEMVAGIGYAGGFPMQRVVIVMASEELTRAYQWGGFTTLLGVERFIPGMSGGPVLNAQGEVVGIVNGLHNVEPLSFSQSLSETPLCAG